MPWVLSFSFDNFVPLSTCTYYIRQAFWNLAVIMNMKFFTGYYCPVSTEFAYQYPCPNGTFNNITGAQDSSLCQICPPGEFCPTPGLALPAGKCSGGWYCTSGSWSSQPAVLGNDTGSTCDCPAQSIGGKCQAGTFCPEGSSAPISCLGGHYCDVAGLDNVTGECLPGKYISYSLLNTECSK